jgi:pimeloyl-ACP methyl ester carboxylesterase
MPLTIQPEPAYAEVNGITMYYEIYGSGEPLVLMHGGGSTIDSSFGRLIPFLAKEYKVIALEMQNHGRSGFRTQAQTFEQDADDVAALVYSIGLKSASFLGFSNGGTTTLQLAIRHPSVVNKLILVAAAYKRSGFLNGFFEGMKQATIDHMPVQLQDAFLKVNPDRDKLQVMFEKDRDRMNSFRDIPGQLVESINFPTLVINGDADVVTTEHTLELHRAIRGSNLAIVPGTHGSYVGEITTPAGNPVVGFVALMIRQFLGGAGEQ